MNLAQKPPMGLKDQRPAADPAYLARVRELPCCICGRWPVDAHHCRSLPPANEPHAYTRLPAHGRKSGDRDTIPLCHDGCHQVGPLSFHQDKHGWERRNGPDYGFIPATRAAVAAILGEIDF